MREYICMLDSLYEEPVRIMAPNILDAVEAFKYFLFRRGYTPDEIKKVHRIIVEVEEK